MVTSEPVEPVVRVRFKEDDVTDTGLFDEPVLSADPVGQRLGGQTMWLYAYIAWRLDCWDAAEPPPGEATEVAVTALAQALVVKGTMLPVVVPIEFTP
jgi:hypothetical protein